MVACEVIQGRIRIYCSTVHWMSLVSKKRKSRRVQKSQYPRSLWCTKPKMREGNVPTSKECASIRLNVSGIRSYPVRRREEALKSLPNLTINNFYLEKCGRRTTHGTLQIAPLPVSSRTVAISWPWWWVSTPIEGVIVPSRTNIDTVERLDDSSNMTMTIVCKGDLSSRLR